MNREEVIAEVKDDARAFNPLTAPEADVTTPLDEKTAGGLGIHLMRKLMDEIDYQRLEDGNLLIMKKTLGITTIRREAFQRFQEFQRARD